MHAEQYEQATKIKKRLGEISQEERIWKNYLTDPNRLGYRPDYGGIVSNASDFNNSIPAADFKKFRDSQLNRLATERATLEAEFAAI